MDDDDSFGIGMIKFYAGAKLHDLVALKDYACEAVEIKLDEVIYIRLFLMFKTTRIMEGKIFLSRTFGYRHMKDKRDAGM